jgi:hypothetical protein
VVQFAARGLALALLVLADLADDTHDAVAVNDLALVTNLLYGGANLHYVFLRFLEATVVHTNVAQAKARALAFLKACIHWLSG